MDPAFEKILIAYGVDPKTYNQKAGINALINASNKFNEGYQNSIIGKFDNIVIKAKDEVAQFADSPSGYFGKQASDFIAGYFERMFRDPVVWAVGGFLVLGFIVAWYVTRRL